MHIVGKQTESWEYQWKLNARLVFFSLQDEMKHLSLTFILLKGWHFVGQPLIRRQLSSVYIMIHECSRWFLQRRANGVTFQLHLCTFWPVLFSAFFFFFFLQPSRWTCRKPWPRPLRPVPRSVWYWATPTAAGCPQPWPSSRVLVATAPPPPLLPPPSPLQCPLLASSRAVPGEPKPTWAAWASWMVATPWAGPCPEKMNWTKGSTGRSSTTPWTDTAVRRRTPSKSSHWRASPPPRSRPPAGAAALSYTSTSCKSQRQISIGPDSIHRWHLVSNLMISAHAYAWRYA